jgi:hypothetical protein
MSEKARRRSGRPVAVGVTSGRSGKGSGNPRASAAHPGTCTGDAGAHTDDPGTSAAHPGAGKDNSGGRTDDPGRSAAHLGTCPDDPGRCEVHPGRRTDDSGACAYALSEAEIIFSAAATRIYAEFTAFTTRNDAAGSQPVADLCVPGVLCGSVPPTTWKRNRRGR